jgi:hypothetical protein
MALVRWPRMDQPERGSIRSAKSAFLAVALLGLLSFSACLGDAQPESAQRSNTGVATQATTTGDETLPAYPPKAVAADDFDPAIFDPERSFVVDNEWLPLEPGTRWVHHGWTEEDGNRIPHSIVFTITDLVKEINGVRALVGWERDFSEGKLVEAELITLAQDRDGNVWHLGQYSEVYEDGELVGGSAWFVGHLDGAKAGIMMKANPELGAPAYSEGFAPPPFFWDDWAKVYKVGQKTCVPVDCFDDVLVTDEFEPTKSGAHQLKYYARGVGNVRTGWRGSDPEREVLVLTKLLHLSPEQMAEARRAALALESRAYVYGRTPPAEPTSGEAEM